MAPKERYQRIPKEDKQSMKMWADGARETILMPHIEPYGDALDRGWMSEKDYLEKVCLEYHSRINWRLADHEEPPLPLAPYDPNAMLVMEDLTEEERQLKTDRIKTLNERIRRWLKYRVKRNRQFFDYSRMDHRKDPYAILLAKLTGLTAPPKARQAYQQFMRDQYHKRIESTVKTAWQAKIRHDHLSSDSTPNAAFRAKIARSVFDQLPKSERDFWQQKAKAEADEAKNEYEERLKNPMPKSLEERQRCIDGIPGFIGPIMQGIQAITGLKFLLVYGGPFPCNEGEITTNHVNYGRSLTSSYFYEWKNFDRNVMGEYKEWLKTCYTQKDIGEARPVSLKDLSLARYSFDDSDQESDSDSNISPIEEEQPAERRPDQPQKSKKKRNPRKRAAPEQSPNTQQPSPANTTSTTTTTTTPSSSSSVPQSVRTSSAGVSNPRKESSGAGRDEFIIDPVLLDAIPSTPSSGPATSQTPASGNSPPSSPVSPPSTLPRVPSPPYSPYDHSNPEGPLVPPNYAKYDQVKAYNVARNKRTLAQIEEQLQSPSKRQKSSDSTPRVLQTASLPTPSDTPPESSTPTTIDSQSLPTTGEERELILPGSASPSEPSTFAAVTRAIPENDCSSSNSATQPSGSGPSDHAEALGPGPSAPGNTSSSAPPQSDPLPRCPSAAPKWMHDSVEGLSKIPLGPEFTNLLRSFIAIEASHGYENPNRGLPAGHRPDALSKWVSSGRWRGKDPIVSNPDEFGVKWWDWWVSLQPKWRQIRRKRPVPSRKYGENWDCLKHPGQNGVLSIVATLYWWGVAVNGFGVPGPAHKSWSAAVADVNWVLDGLVRHLESSE